MQKIVHKFIRAVAIAAVAFSFLAVATPTFALFESAKNQACNGVSQTESGCAATNQDSQVESTLSIVLNLFSFAVGIMVVIMIIIGGVKFVTSQGDSGAVTGARNTIIYALVGLVIVLLAQFIVHFVLGRAAAAPTASVQSVNHAV